MKTSLSLGRILGFPVDVHFTLLLFLAAVFVLGGGTAGVVLLVATFASVLAHELGHSVVARRLGVPILGITLYPFGGMAKMAAPARTPGDEIKIAAAGPAVSLALAGIFGVAWALTGASLFLNLGAVNGILGVFNLLPALPMDGGRIFRAILARRRGPLAATRIAAKVARVLAVGLGVLGVFTNPMLAVIAVLVWWMAGSELRAAEAAAVRARGGAQPELALLLEQLRRMGFVAEDEDDDARRPPGDPPSSSGFGPRRPSTASQMVVEVDPARS